MTRLAACLCVPVHRSALCVESGGAGEDALDWAGEVETVDVSDAVEVAFPSSSRVGLSADRAFSNSIAKPSKFATKVRVALSTEHRLFDRNGLRFFSI